MNRSRSLLREDFSVNTKALLATPGIRAFLIWAFIFFSAVSYGWRNFYRDPGSIFFDPSRAYERWYSQWREFQADTFIAKAEADVILSAGKVGVNFNKAGTNPSICASFVTVRRNVEKQYVEASIGSLLQGLDPAERADLHLNTFFATTEPSRHPTWNQTWLRPLVDDVYTYEDVLESEQFTKLRQLESLGKESLLEKGVTDYTIALNRCYEKTSAPYIAVFEDDIVVAEGWLVRTLLGLRAVEANMIAKGQAGNWLYMRLFNQERSTGWASSAIGGNHEHWISLGIGLGICAILVGYRRRSRVVRAHLDNWALAVICLLAVPSFVILFFQSGKASLVPPLPGVREEPFGCCSQGLVFAREHVPGLIEYLRAGAAERPEQPTELRQNEVGKYDMMTRDYSRQTGLSRWALYPVQIQHIGIRSTIQTKEHEAQAVWSTAFETLNPKSLGKTHARMVKQVYGGAPAPNGQHLPGQR